MTKEHSFQDSVDEVRRVMENDEDRKPFTLRRLKQKIQEIREMAGDPEAAHSKEDELRERVLREIASGNPEYILLAEEVLKTSLIRFDRWYS